MSLKSAQAQMLSLAEEVDTLRARCARLEAAINEIDRCFCPMAASHPWVQAGLDSARKVLDGDGSSSGP